MRKSPDPFLPSAPSPRRPFCAGYRFRLQPYTWFTCHAHSRGRARHRFPDLGGQIAPYFAVVQIIFMLLFVAYFVLGVVSIVVDFEAMDCDCAEDSWIWLYALLVIVIPTSMGVVMVCLSSPC